MPRPRVDRRTGNAYVPADHAVHGWKALCRLRATEAARRTPHPTAVIVSLTFVFSRPGWLADDDADHTETPDLDNLVKASLDAWKGILWADDRQVAALTAAKRYARPGDPAGLAVRVEASPLPPPRRRGKRHRRR